MTGKLFLIVGPSGSGKGTVIKELQRKYKGFVYPISYTTRQPRDGEEDGQVYHFITKDKFKEMIEAGEFLEYATVHSDNFYGTAKKEILEALEGSAVVIREVDMQGFHSIKNLVPKENLVSIFMKVISEEDLSERILRRGEISEDELNKRMESARKEIAQSGDCDYQVENEWGYAMRCVTSVEKIVLDEIKNLY
ncbi:MAG: guanylate kinase [Patescibacteria group bacterium]